MAPVINWKQAQPAPSAMFALTKAHFPSVRNLGIFNPGHDDHDEGRALDSGFLVSNPDENEIAWGLIDDVFLPHPKEIGWTYFIWDQWMFYPDARGKQKGGFKGDHTNHIHMSWSRDSSQQRSFPGADAAMGELARKLSALAWLKGWWEVWDGNYYYYYFGGGGVVQYTKAKPSTTVGPPKRADNIGRYVVSSASRVELTWRQVPGAESACQERFYNATPGCRRMNATSNLYSPLVATRL